MGPIELVKAVRERLKRQELHLGTGQGFYARVRMINDLAALCDLVERLEKALEKCRQQRNDWIAACKQKDKNMIAVCKIRASENAELDAILKGGKG